MCLEGSFIDLKNELMGNSLFWVEEQGNLSNIHRGNEYTTDSGQIIYKNRTLTYNQPRKPTCLQ